MAFPFTSHRQTEQTQESLQQQSRQNAQADEHGMLDVPFLVLTILLTIIGVTMMFSASYAAAYHETHNSAYFFFRQSRFALVGLVIMIILSFFPKYPAYKGLSLPGLAGSIVLLMLVLVLGEKAGGARRWFSIGVRFQPSELAKIAIILFYATVMTTYPRSVDPGQKGFFMLLGSLVVTCGLIVAEPHFSATLIVAATAAAMLMFGGMKKKWLIPGGIAAGILILILILSQGYATERLTTYGSGNADSTGSGYQILQSLNAIGSGGLMGLGFGKSRQKYLYLPEGHNDYVFAIVCEELGFVGALVVLLLFALLILRGYWIALHAKDRFGALITAGIITQTAIQIVLNIAVVTGSIPSTGISLPFFSYGGTALLVQLAEMGIVLNVSRECTNKII